ncbi:MAG: Spy/CpxP family protein refolding chaperone [Pseudomonadota bacterium]
MRFGRTIFGVLAASGLLAAGFFGGAAWQSGALASVVAHLGGGAAQPYAGQDARAVKALSPARLQGLLAGQGLGYAKTAELTGWPGPLHVLELEDQLSLSADQKQQMETLRQDMLNRVKPLGEQLIEAEKALETVFAAEQPSRDAVQAATAKVAEIEGRLRAAHLTTHLAAAPMLNDEQRATYISARGYGQGGHADHTGHAGH